MTKVFSWKKLCIKLIVVAVLLLILVVSLMWVIYKAFAEQRSPTEGVWYCSELGLEISYNTERRSYLETSEGKILCTIKYRSQSKYLQVFTSTIYTLENGNEVVNWGEQIFDFEYKELAQTHFVVSDDSGNKYTFHRKGEAELENPELLKYTVIETFNLNAKTDYLKAIREFSTNEAEQYLGEIPNAETAKAKAEAQWAKLYGACTFKPYPVSFDNENGVWLVEGYLADGETEDVLQILMQKSDGKILAVWKDETDEGQLD